MVSRDYRLLYRSRRTYQWLSHHWPGPMPQVYSTARVQRFSMCTCDHYGENHPTARYSYQEWKYSEPTAWQVGEDDINRKLKSFRGKCDAVHPQTGTPCPCTYFLEAQIVLTQAQQDYRDKQKIWRPIDPKTGKKEKLLPLPRIARFVDNEVPVDEEWRVRAQIGETADWERVHRDYS